MSKILIAGGTGLIGMQLSQLLSHKGHQVVHLSRSYRPNATYPAYKWDIFKGEIDPDALEEVDYIINLAGAGIADKRWSNQRKKMLIDSRVHGTSTLARFIVEGEVNPKAFISASAIGFYGNRGDEMLDEESERGMGFLADCTVAWENAISKVAKTGVRTVGLRIGIVLSEKGGALEKMVMPFKFGSGNWFGNGSQYYSWIHINDVCKMFLHAIEKEEMEGFYNAVSPNPSTNKEMAYAIKEARGKFALMMPVPKFTLRAAMGEMADVVLHGNKVSSEKIQSTGFTYEYPELLPALKDLLA